MKSKYITILLFAAAIALGAYYFLVGEKDPQGTAETVSDKQSNSQVQEVPNALEGELKESNDKKKGNLMLVKSDGKTIYLNTSRDFSSLIGKQVQITIEGSMDDFMLLDIKPK